MDQKRNLLYVCFGDAYSWDDVIEKEFPKLINYLNSNFNLKALDYFDDRLNFDDRLKELEKWADIIVYDQTISSCGEASNHKCEIGYRPIKNQTFLTIAGNLEEDVLINELKRF